MNRISYLIAAACSLTAVAAGGCSSTPAKTASTIAGSVAQASFPKAVSAITVKSDSGKTSTVAVGSDGKFSAQLEKGASYQFFLGDDGKSIPIVLKSDQDRLQTQVHVKAGGASLNIGSVRYWGGVTTAEAKVITAPGAASKSCVGGVFANSSQPCASGVSPAVCSDEDDDDGESNDDHGDHADSPEEQGADCVDGLDATTHQVCDGGPEANSTSADKSTDVDATASVGVPESNVPDDVGCDDEEDDDGEEAD